MRYIIGIDGGGTKTLGILVNENANLLAKAELGPSNYHVLGKLKLKELIGSLVDKLIKQSKIAPEVDAICVGLAGAGRENERNEVTKLVKELNCAKQILAEHDASIALAGALGGNPGIMIIAGTGSIAFGRNADGKTARAGGWGYLLGDEGSGFYIGQKALIAALKEWDGRGEKTKLTDIIINEYGVSNIEGIIEKVYSEKLKSKGIGKIAPLVFKAAKNGDRVAKGIVEEAGRELGTLASAVMEALGLTKNVEIALVGSIFKQKELLLDSLRDAVPSEANVTFCAPRFPPVIGAALLALKKIGVKTDEFFLAKLEAIEI
jgi:N-acetylglucosamine kinase-like BadF-type ATPase